MAAGFWFSNTPDKQAKNRCQYDLGKEARKATLPINENRR
jgi:hypothetical protein